MLSERDRTPPAGGNSGVLEMPLEQKLMEYQKSILRGEDGELARAKFVSRCLGVIGWNGLHGWN
jgi:hypothetical protein